MENTQLTMLNSLIQSILLYFAYYLPTARGKLVFRKPDFYLENLPLYIRNKCFKIKLKIKSGNGSHHEILSLINI
jgi:hypothetical protein